VIIKPGLLVLLLAGIPIPPVADLGTTLVEVIRGGSIRMVLLVGKVPSTSKS
jgi:hypothetical protein